MKKTVLSLTLSLALTSVFAQQHTCGFDHHNEELNLQNPGRADQIHQGLINASHGTHGFMDRSSIIVPVVVHVIHKGGESDISYEQILSGIEMLNDDYNRENDDTVDTRNTSTAPFQPYAANIGISFELAKIDPNGNCTNGVERRYNPGVTDGASDNAKHYSQGGLDAWDRNKYMNIWVVSSIESDGEGVTLGYAEFPYSGGSSNYGVIIRHDAFGSVGTASGDRTITHELGHCFGLLHTFQGGCHSDDCSDNGDYCCDTPPESEAHWSCGTNQNSCTDVPVNDIYGFDSYDQWENFMSYAPCQNMFSEDQKAIILYNLTDINFLSNLTSLANQIATGVGQPEQLCNAAFTSNVTVICAGSSINFSDQSYFNISGRTWNFSGGTPNVSTDANPVVTYNTPGVYDISLEVTDGVSTVSTIANDYVIVLANPGEGLPYVEGFESFTAASFPDNQQFLLQNDDSGQGWDIFDDAAYQGTQCLKLKNFGETDGSSDAFISGGIDLSSLDSTDELIFSFYYSYKKRSDANDEWLQFYVSKDCGETWALRKNIHGDQLNDLFQNTPFTPAMPMVESDWVEVVVTNINPDYFVSDFRYKFVFTNDAGNNIYIDNINLYPTSMISIDESQPATSLEVYPNPASEQLVISFESANEQFATINVQNTLGQVVYVSRQDNLVTGLHTWQIDVSKFEAGVYFVSVQTENGTQLVKFIKE